MKGTSLQLLNELPLQDESLFKLIHGSFMKESISYMLIGAKCRDIILEHCFNIECPRATLDSDLAICISKWQDFNFARNLLIENGNFIANDKILHRLESNEYGIVDLIPFGEIEEDHQVAWPPEYNTVMSTVGFSEVYEKSIEIKINDALVINTASLAGLALLKLIAWRDRSFLTKDAIDISSIACNYLRAGNQERLFEEHSDLVVNDFDYEVAGARVLGRDIGSFITEGSLEYITKIFDNECNEAQQQLLTVSIAKTLVGRDNSFITAGHIVNALYSGIIERRSVGVRP